MFDLYKKCIGPYMGISRDCTRTCGDKKYRLVIYGAYNAMGLIGPENNGVAVFNETDMDVTADQLFKISSGYFGPDQYQLKNYIALLTCNDTEFKNLVNTSGRNRYSI